MPIDKVGSDSAKGKKESLVLKLCLETFHVLHVELEKYDFKKEI